jgi:hypothetical protein
MSGDTGIKTAPDANEQQARAEREAANAELNTVRQKMVELRALETDAEQRRREATQVVDLARAERQQQADRIVRQASHAVQSRLHEEESAAQQELSQVLAETPLGKAVTRLRVAQLRAHAWDRMTGNGGATGGLPHPPDVLGLLAKLGEGAALAASARVNRDYREAIRAFVDGDADSIDLDAVVDGT